MKLLEKILWSGGKSGKTVTKTVPDLLLRDQQPDAEFAGRELREGREGKFETQRKNEDGSTGFLVKSVQSHLHGVLNGGGAVLVEVVKPVSQDLLKIFRFLDGQGELVEENKEIIVDGQRISTGRWAQKNSGGKSSAGK